MSFIDDYIREGVSILEKLDRERIEAIISGLLSVRNRGGRLFFLGVGGSAAQCSHAVNDARKLAAFEAYTPVDNISELTARVNDEGWPTVFVEWLKGSRLNKNDAVFVFSVGGGNDAKNISPNLVEALKWTKETGAATFGVVGRDDGYTAQEAEACLVIPPVNEKHITAHAEAFQAFVWHLIISDPRILQNSYKWESVSHNKQ